MTTIEAIATDIAGHPEPNSNARPGAFKAVWTLLLGEFLFVGAGNVLFGVALPGNVFTFFMYAALLLQLLNREVQLPRFLLSLYGFVFFWTFILSYSGATAVGSLTHFVGIVLVSVVAFSFVGTHKDRIFEITRGYYYFVFGAAVFAVIQTVAFVAFGEQFLFYKIFSSQQASDLTVENFGLLPRAASLASEPATYATIAMPGAFIALLVWTGRAKVLGLKNKWIASTILLGFVLSFSMVGYFGLLLAVLQIFIPKLWRHRLLAIPLVVGIGASGYYAMTNLNTFTKITLLFSAAQDGTSHEFTGSDLSGFALISNALVTVNTLENSHYLGTGLNTHGSNYDKYLPTLFTNSQVVMELNKDDAGSLFIRIASEFGVPGLLCFLFFLVRYKLWTGVCDRRYQIVNDAAVVFIFVYASRTGQYIDPILWLFVALFYYSSVEARVARTAGIGSANVIEETSPR